MASKTIDHLTLMVRVTPYEHEGNKYDGLLIIVAYHKGRGFVCSWQPVLLTGYGYQTGPMPSSDPLVGGKGFQVKAANRNDVAFLKAMHTRLTEGQAGIRLYFDQRDYDRLKLFMATVAEYGYSDELRKGIEETINNQSNNQNQTVMATIEMNNESKNAAQQQVTNEMQSVAVGEVTLDSILPTMQAESEPAAEPTKQEVAQAISKAATEGTATTMPLGSHGTLVIAGVGGGEKKVTDPTPAPPLDGRGAATATDKPKVTLRKKQPEPDPEAVGELAGGLTRVTLVTYQTKRGETAPRIIGFSGEDDPRYKPILDEKLALVAAYNKAKKRDPKAKMTSSPFGPAWLTDREGTGEKTYCMTLGVRYMDVARQLCEAYNTTDRNRWQQAEQAVRDLKNGIVADYQTQKAARQAEREAKRAAKKGAATAAAQQPAAQTGYTDEQVAAMLRQIMAGGELPAGVKEALAKAA